MTCERNVTHNAIRREIREHILAGAHQGMEDDPSRSRASRVVARAATRDSVFALAILRPPLRPNKIPKSRFYPVYGRLFLLGLMLDVVTVNGRVSGHLHRPSSDTAGENSPRSTPCPDSPPLRGPFSFRHHLSRSPSVRESLRALATLAGLFALKHYWLDASAGGTNSGLFHIRDSPIFLCLSLWGRSRTRSLRKAFDTGSS